MRKSMIKVKQPKKFYGKINIQIPIYFTGDYEKAKFYEELVVERAKAAAKWFSQTIEQPLFYNGDPKINWS